MNKKYFKLNLIYFIAIISVAIIFALQSFGFINNEFLSAFLIQIVTMLAIPLLLYSLFFKKNFNSTLKDVGFKKISAKSVLIIIGLGFALYFLNTYVAAFFSSIITSLGYEKLSQPATVEIDSFLLFKEFLLSCILPGICEEVLHRGIMLHAGKKIHNPKYCLIISSILFGFTHLNINQFFYTAILGFLMGYVNLVCDSIYPSIIIHFMNNFLSNYFYYGTKLKLPLASFFAELEVLLLENFFVFVFTISIAVILIWHFYKYCVKELAKERNKNEIQNILKHLKLNQLSIEQAQERINQANLILRYKAITSHQPKTKPTFASSIFLISSIVLGTLITLSTFIWGII